MKKKYSLVIDGHKLSVPDPIIISLKALKQYGRIQKKTGLLVVYDPDTHAGGFLVPGSSDNTRWTIYIPLSLDEFTIEVNRIMDGAFGMKMKSN